MVIVSRITEHMKTLPTAFLGLKANGHTIHTAMKYLALLATLLFVGSSFCEDIVPEIPESLAGNIRVHLVGARMGARPFGTRHLIAKFRPEDGGREFFCEFPAKPNTGHEATLVNVIRSSINWTDRESGNEWPPVDWDTPKLDLVLSMPPPRAGEVAGWSRWVVVSVSAREQDKRGAGPDSAASGSQPARSETNRTSSAAASRL